MKTLKFFIPFALLGFTLIYQTECHAINKTISPTTKNDKITFVKLKRENDESLKLKEKIRKEMDEYIKLKESMNKETSTTIKTMTETSPTSTTQPPSSSTVRRVHLIGIEELAHYDETTLSNDNFDNSTLDAMDTTTDVANRNILDAPNLCKDGKQYVSGRCRTIY